MTPTGSPPQPYRPGLIVRLTEGLRYGGGVGQWSWLFHRITGLGILAFLVVHIIDTFFVVAYPGLYDHTTALYGGRVPWVLDESGQPTYFWPIRWAFRLAELGLIACVVFHAINGVRVALFDLWPGAVKHQKAIFQVVMVVVVVIMLVVSVFVFLPLTQAPEFWNFPHESAGAPTTAPPGP